MESGINKMSNKLKKRAKPERDLEKSDIRPWGRYLVLDKGPEWKVKRIEVKPGQRLSYQRHFRRRERWVVVKGKAIVTLDGKDIHLETGDSIDIPVKTGHRIANPGRDKLVFIEVQQGSYFGEDDIERLEDDYGRIGSKVGRAKRNADNSVR